MDRSNNIKGSNKQGVDVTFLSALLSGVISNTRSYPTVTRSAHFVLTTLIALMVISSPFVIFIDPAVIAATTNPIEKINTKKIDTSSYHTTPRISETSSSAHLPTALSSSPTTSGTPTTQAAFSAITVRQTNNIVNTFTYYDITFKTTTTGTIKEIEVTFPADTIVPGYANFIEVEGIGPGTVSKSGQTLTYTVDNAISVPADTFIRLEFSRIVNPPTPSDTYQLTVTTRNAAGNIIDGPTASIAYKIKQIETADIANNAIINTKISPTFMISRLLEDSARGDSFGWNPDGIETNFIIIDENAISDANPVLINVGDEGSNSQCESLGSLSGFFTIQCANPPPGGSELRYTIINLPLR